MTRGRAAGAGDRHTERFDVLIVGSGVAGLSLAVRLAGAPGPAPSVGRVGVLTKGALAQSATRWAQGGVAAVLGGDEDSTDWHLADTLAAGAGLCDLDAVRVLVDEGPARVHELVALGVQFDREASGHLSLAREGGHSRARVVHANGAATGAEVERALVEATRRSVAAVLEHWFAHDLLITDGRCRGVRARRPDGAEARLLAEHVVLATGGAGQLFAVTTNPPEATGDGIAMALRAGVPVSDVEFVQFHPTALHHPAMPRPLLSEALRGHGALIRDARGERFVDELAPRDVVCRAMASRMAEQGVSHLWLDATCLDHFADRFPTLAASLAQAGLDPSTDWLPIAPAAHHVSGGILTDLWGASAVPGLWAAGEVACTGVHGANRLASNSLLEGMVFGARCAEALLAGRDGPSATGALRTVLDAPDHPVEHPIGIRSLSVANLPSMPSGLVGGLRGAGRTAGAVLDLTKARDLVQQAMSAGSGVVRSARSLAATADGLAGVVFSLGDSDACARGPDEAPGAHVQAGELFNLVTLGSAIVAAAACRQESRGAHTRSDFPETSEGWRQRIVLRSPP